MTWEGGKRLHELMVRDGISAHQVSMHTGLRTGAVRGWIDGKRPASIEDVAALRKVWSGLSLDWIQYGEGNPPGEGQVANTSKEETTVALKYFRRELPVESMVDRAMEIWNEDHVQAKSAIVTKVVLERAK